MASVPSPLCSPSAPLPFTRIPVGGRPVPRPKTGITEVDIEVTILHRCLDRLTSRRLQRDALPPPNTVHAALSPVITPVVPLVNGVRELQTDDPAVRYTADGFFSPTLRPGLKSRRSLVGADGRAMPYRDHIPLEELEAEVSIMRTSLDNLVLMINQFAVTPLPQAASQLNPLRSNPPSPGASLRAVPAQTAGEVGDVPMEPEAEPSAEVEEAIELAAAAQSMSVSRPRVESLDAHNPLLLASHRSGESSLAKPSEGGAPADDNSFWGRIARFCVYGLGSYQFHIGEVGNRLRLAKEAERYGLGSLADELFAHSKCTIHSRELRYYVHSADCPQDSRISALHEALGSTKANAQHIAVRECPGILYYLGCHYGAQAWQNPAQMLDRRLLDVRTSSSYGPGKAADVATAYVGYFISQDQPASWIEFDFGHHLVIPKCYSFASNHPMYAGFYPRHWEFQGSLDGKTWTCLRRHVNDTTLNRFHPVGYWLLEGPKGKEKDTNKTFYRYLRILQTGPNSFSTNELQLSSFEVYGQLIFLSHEQPLPPPASPWPPQHTRSPSPPPSIPEAPRLQTPKPKAKKGK
eukprot:GGOE01001888.1.p1 GENE.GGOE01001888.1~~GGOE01001888.1.p1  ORF type:complete len:578 (-),score=131.73 GGOE01001888.1:134-1867(-)